MNADQAKTLDELMAEAGEKVVTSFLVFQTHEGQWVALANYKDKTLVSDREATIDDIIGGTEAVKLSCAAQQAAMVQVAVMEQRAMAVQQAMEQQRAAQQVAKLIDPAKLRSSNA